MQDALNACPLFADLSETERAQELAAASRRSYRKGEMLHRGGTPFPYFGLVLRGTVYVYTTDLDGAQILMASVTVGGTFGESHCYLQTPAPNVWAEAAEDTEVLWLSAQKIADDPTLSARFTKMLAMRTLAMNDRIQILSQRTIREKLLTYFAFLCRDGERTFSVPFDRNAMATYLGSDRSAVSRELGKLKAEGKIDYYRNTFRLLDEKTD